MFHYPLYNQTEAFSKVKFDNTPCWTSLGNYRRISLRAIRLKYKNWYFENKLSHLSKSGKITDILKICLAEFYI